jgi:hypothetical protein
VPKSIFRFSDKTLIRVPLQKISQKLTHAEHRVGETGFRLKPCYGLCVLYCPFSDATPCSTSHPHRRLGQNAEAKTAQNNREYVMLNIATQESWKNDKGDYENRTQWHSVYAWSG